MNGNRRALRVLAITSRRRRLRKDATEATPTPLPGGRHTIDLLSPAYPALRSEGTAIVSNAVPQVRRS